jgi:DNA mismatch repair protein MutL
MAVRRLDPVLIDRIAAGEVIERPAAVVKELVENAIDAGARALDIVIEGGGARLIRVVDDGNGMTRGDLELAVERHATSKIPDNDLTNIATLGFRGEALPSIGAVARLAITSRHKSEPHAWALAISGGARNTPSPASLERGTRIDVADLFYATPARLKFLKTDRAEAQAAREIVRRLALAHPEIRFGMAGDGLTAFDWRARPVSAEGALARMGDVLGRDFADNAVAIDAEREGLRLSGFAGLPSFLKANSTDQHMFVNGRPVRDRQLFGAIKAAYADLAASDRHPVVVLFIDCDPQFVDVNVHPAKSEVRFRDPGLVRGLIIGALRAALAAGGSKANSRLGPDLAARFSAPSAGNRSFAQGTGSERQAIRDWRESPYSPTGFEEARQQGFETGPSAPAGDAMASNDIIDRPLGAARAQLHETYIVSQTRSGMILVDAHAAHERLVYERLKANAAETPATQMLLIPAIVELDEAEAGALLEQAPIFRGLGLALEAFGAGAIAVSEVPAAIAGADIVALIRDLAANLDQFGSAPLEAKIQHVLKTFACHHSVRSGRRLKPEEMNALLREMEATPGSGTCNHGRPTYIELKLSELEKLFGRR